MQADAHLPCALPFRYMAPEVLRENQWSKAADVYSFSRVLYELIARSKPCDDFDVDDHASAIAMCHLRPKLPADAPDLLASLIKRCWNHDPGLRPAFPSILQVERSQNLDEEAHAHALRACFQNF